ncbi:uncharacterized protein PAE49_021404 [Odontesthes bonariensis]|uniref:uncharacterized protein LOC142368810 n=1 Tax=Odontesthes bonariensis TaxID=219752 RepID=UPI003F58FE44
MERYESLGPVGEGSYGTVLKCRHRDSGRLVAIKKFMDSDEDKTVKKIALREIKLLRQLRHDNLVNLLEVWKRRRRWYLVFEFVDRTLLDDLEQNPSGLDLTTSRQYLYQILRATDFCHQQNVIHRDIKPENILISQGGVVKLCDFGFARTMALPSEGSVYTDYVATRWYRAPELLVGDIKYGKPVDVWAVGCLLMEMLTGQPLFPGDSDLDQIYHIVKCFGNLVTHHQELFYRNPVFSGVKLPEASGTVPLQQRFPTVTPTAMDLTQMCLEMDPERRAQCSELLEHPLFTQGSFNIRFLDELNAKIQKEHRENSTLPKIIKTPKQEKGDEEEKICRSKDKKMPEDMEDKSHKEKIEKIKGKQPLKMSKTIHNISEPVMSKQSKTLGNKCLHNAGQSSIAMKSKPGKATGAELRKEAETSKSTKSLISESADEAKSAASIKKKITVAEKNEHKSGASPEPRKDHLKNIKDTDYSGLDNEKNSKKLRTISKSEPSQEFAKTCRDTNSKVPKLLKNATTNGQNLNLSSKVALESAVDRTGNILAPPKSTPNSSPKTNISTSTLPTTPLRTLTSDFSEEPPTVFMDTTPAHNTAAPPKGIANSMVSKSGCTSKALSKGKELTEDEDMKRETACLMMTTGNSSQMPQALGGGLESTEFFLTCTGLQRTKIATEDRMTSASILNEKTSVGTTVLKTPKISKKDHQEDLIFPLSIMPSSKPLINQTTKAAGRSGGEKGNSSSDFESDAKSLKVPKPKQRLTKPGSLSNHMRTGVTLKTPKTTLGPDAKKKSDNPESNDKTNRSNMADMTLTTSTDHKALTRSFVLHNMDVADLKEFDFNVPQSSTPPPPPPPSSTPLLLHPSSTSLISSLSVVNSAANDHLRWGAGFHPGTHNLRCVDKPKHHSGIYDRQTQQFLSSHITGSFTFQSENNLVCERSFLSDHCDLGNNSSAAAKNKSHVHFPDLRSSLLPELRGREGKHNKGTSKDQGKDKHPDQPSPASEAQQHGHDTETYTQKQMQ